MPDNIQQIYGSLLQQQHAVAMHCLETITHRDRFTQCHNFLKDIGKYIVVVGARPEAACIRSAAHEHQYALSAALMGHYRHAFSSLRLTLELLVSTIHFSGHEFDLRQWESAKSDLSWQRLIDADKGVFSAPFVGAFHSFLDELREKYRGLAVATYRECSEFVHGNPTQTRPLEGEIEFREGAFNLWCDAVENVRLVVTYLFLYRYIESANSVEMDLLEGISTDNIWHEEQVRACFGGD